MDEPARSAGVKGPSGYLASLVSAALLGLVVPVILVAAGWLLSEDNWTCALCEFEYSWRQGIFRCLTRGVIVLGASGLCVGYLVGLTWDRLDVSPAGLVIALLAALFLGGLARSSEAASIFVLFLLGGVISLVAVPLGLLVGWLLHGIRLPWLVLALGTVLVALAVGALLSEPTYRRVTGQGIFPVPGTHYEALYAVPLLVAGAATVAVAMWSWLRRG